MNNDLVITKPLEVYCPNIDDLSVEEIMTYVTDDDAVLPKKKRRKLVEALYQVLGYNLEPDLLLALCDETKNMLILAPAGGGKTTGVSTKLLCEKIWRESRLRKGKVKGQNILCLVYNKENVRDIRERHASMVHRFKRLVTGVDYLDETVVASTIHSFCKAWIEDYELLCGISKFKFMEDSEKESLMKSSTKIMLKKFNSDLEVDDINLNLLSGLYNFMRESMMSYNDIVTNDKFIDLNLDVELVEGIFTTYDNVKKRKKRYDYTDQLTIFYNLVTGVYDTPGKQEHLEVLDRISKSYEIITADEFQDFTLLLQRILRIISQDARLICIGDDDQGIYGFRGADNNNILKFPQIFEDSKVFLLKTNRRCPRNVVDLSTTVISQNRSRFEKDIRAINPDGKIEFRGYNDRRGQFMAVVNLVKSMTEEERANTCICYRNRSSSTVLGDLLVENKVHFHMLSGIPPYSYPLYKAVFDVLRALRSGTNKQLLFNLYKCLPINRDEMASALKYNPEKNEATDGNMLIKLADIDFGNKVNNQQFNQALSLIKKISQNIDDLYLKDYIHALVNLIRKYYWEWQVKMRKLNVEDDIEYNKSLLNYLNVPKTFSEKYAEHEEVLAMLKRDNQYGNGVCLSTFHSLKGLEFDNVIIVDLQESIFPNQSLVESRPYDELTKTALIECETRLFYVAVTRTKKRLIMYYSNFDPSIYVTLLMNSEVKTKAARSIVKASAQEKLDAINSEIEKVVASDSFTDDDDDDFVDDFLDEEDEAIDELANENSSIIIANEDTGASMTLEEVKAKTKEELGEDKPIEPQRIGNFRQNLFNRYFGNE